VIPPRQVAQIRELYQQRLESLLAVDEGVERIVAQLQAVGELDDTLIVFTSDNGFFHGEHRIPNGKVLLYEPSIRVPLILRGPGIPRGRRLTQVVANIDLAPTILDAARAAPGRKLDGRSLLPLARDPGVSWGRDLLLQRGGGGAQVFHAIRTPRFKYAEYGNGEKELYDLALDPDELQSRHADPAYAGIRDELARRLAALRRCAGAACRLGPRLGTALRYRRGPRGCAHSSVRETLGGADVGRVSRVEFRAGGRLVGVDTQAPFTRAISRSRLDRRGTLLRLRASLNDGHVVTYDRRLRRCP
jgi:hypothetical protein